MTYDPNYKGPAKAGSFMGETATSSPATGSTCECGENEVFLDRCATCGDAIETCVNCYEIRSGCSCGEFVAGETTYFKD